MSLVSDFSDFFWNLVEQAHFSPEKLTEVLMKQSKQEIRRFDEELQEAHSMLWYSEADEILRGGFHCSDDTVDDIFGYVILQGKDFYDKIILDPQRIAEVIDESACLIGVPSMALFKGYGENIEIPEGVEQIPMKGTVITLEIPVPELSRPEGKRMEAAIEEDFDAVYGDRLVSSGGGDYGTIRITFLIEDREAFEKNCKTIVSKHLPGRSYDFIIHEDVT